MQPTHDAAYWRALNPALSISQALPSRLPRRSMKPGLMDGLSDWMRREGYCAVPPVVPQAILGAVRTAIATVERAGFLPAFAWLYDAPWIATRHAAVRRFATTLLGPQFRMLPDFWAYHIRSSSQGYRPHREVGGAGMEMPNGDPTAITVWMPLTDATLDNGCMYVIPLDLETQPMDPAQYGRDNKLGFVLHRVRALPARAGALLSWNHLVMHWGSCTNARATQDRESIAFEFIRGDVDPATHPHAKINPVYASHRTMTLDPTGPLPTFEQRLYLIGRNLLSYYEGTNEDYRKAARQLLKQGWPAGELAHA